MLGLHSDKVVMAERPQRLGMLRQRQQDVRRRARDMEKEADQVAVAERPQLLSKRQKMVIMHPDCVIRANILRQRLGKARVHPQVTPEIDRGKLREIDAVMEDRPQNAVGEAVVIFPKVARRQIEGDVRPLRTLNHGGFQARAIFAYPSAPAEPDAFAPFQCGVDRDGEPAGLARPLGIGYRDSV